MEQPSDLRADCARCSALCCVALPYTASSDFAYDKEAGRPCVHLAGFSCSIHERLPERGFVGCTVFDCFGAGQLVTQQTYASVTWRDRPDLSTEIFEVFGVVRQLQELRWYLRQADRADQPVATRRRVRELEALTEDLTGQPAEALRRTDVAAHRAAVDEVLSAVSRRVRSVAVRQVHDRSRRPRKTRRADLVGVRLRGVDLRGCDFRSALLLGADLRDADLRGADLIGADLRAADLSGADLSDALYVTEPQLAGAGGDETTLLPAGVRAPSHWGSPG